MGGTWPERTLRFGRTKKISEVFKQRKDPAKRMKNDKRGSTEKLQETSGVEQRQEKKRDRKSYPLRGRGGVTDGEALSCHVLLTRLEESVKQRPADRERRDASQSQARASHKTKHKKGKSGEKREKSRPKTKLKAFGWGEGVHADQPRKRRLASLNAEAVNSLLLERATDAQPPSKQPRRLDDPTTGGAGVSSSDGGPVQSLVPGGPKGSRGSVHRTSASSCKLEPHQSSSKQARKSKAVREGGAALSQESLDAPAPRRLAGLNAAALLKLTSSSATSKQRARAAPAATVASDCRGPAAASQHNSRGKQRGHAQKQKTGKKASGQHGGCTTCKKKADFEPKVEWEASASCAHRLTKPGYQSRMLAYPLKQVKEEQLETELSPCYCCPPGGSVEYCHRFAFFLGQQAYGDSDDKPLSPPVPPVKRECLVTQPPLGHSHPHTALALGPHPCLCTADHCFSSYYVHIAHPTHPTGGTTTTTATSAANLPPPPRPLNFAPPSGLCPSRVPGSKLLAPQVSHASTLTHPAYCNSVTSACYGDACGIGGYAYRAMPPVTSRGCSFSAGCTGCTRSIKTGSSLPLSLQKEPLFIRFFSCSV